MKPRLRAMFRIKLLAIIFLPLPFTAHSKVASLKVPKGFKIEMWADGIEDARSLALSPEGWLFIGSRSQDRVYAVDTKLPSPRKARIIADGLKSPNGVAFKQGILYVAEIGRIIAFDDIVSKLRAPAKPEGKIDYRVVVDDYPKDEHHGWKFIRFGPDGKLYIPIGAPCNVCARKDPYATITRLDLDSKKFEIIARGIRNSVGFDWDDEGHLWFTENGRDNLGDDKPPCEINVLENLAFATAKVPDYGFPGCHGRDIIDPQFGHAGDCTNITPPVLSLQAHVAPLGLRVLNLKSWPAKYRGGLFFAEHGSWNRSSKVGYKVMFAPRTGAKAGAPQDLVSGFLQGQKTLGRPVDIEPLPDDSLLISDDEGGCIWRLSYEGPKK